MTDCLVKRKKTLFVVIMAAVVVAALSLCACSGVLFSKPKSYTITFLSYDFYETRTFTYGMTKDDIDIPPVPEMEGKIGKWEDFELEPRDFIVRPVYMRKPFTLTFVAGSEVVGSVFVDSEATEIEEPEVPSFLGMKGEWEDYNLDDFVGDDYVRALYTSDYATDGLTYYEYGEEYYVSGYEGIVSDVSIPEYYRNKKVAGIMARAFANNTVMAVCRIPSSVTYMEFDVFSGCKKLLEVLNKSSVDVVRQRDFLGIPSLTSVKNDIVAQSDIKNYNGFKYLEINGTLYLVDAEVDSDGALVLPETIEGRNYSLYKYAFSQRTDIKKLVCKGSMVLSEYAFFECSELESVIVLPDNHVAFDNTAFSGCCFIKELTVDTVNLESFWQSTATVTKLGLSGGSLGGRNAITDQYKSLKWLELDGVTVENGGVAYNNKLLSITLSGDTTLYESAVKGCSSIIEVIDKTNKGIITPANKSTACGGFAANAFIDNSSSATTKIVIMDDCYYYLQGKRGLLVSYDGNATSLELPEKVNGYYYDIGNYAFSGAAFETIVLPKGIESVGDYAFSECYNLQKINLPGVKSIGRNAFANNYNLLPTEEDDEFNYIDKWLLRYFGNSPSVRIKDGIVGIMEDAFVYSNKMYSVTLPATLNSIGYNAFDNCGYIYEVYNLSGMTVSAGVATEKNGYVAKNAKIVHASEKDASIIKNQNGFIYVDYKADVVLLSYVGTEMDLVLPDKLGSSSSYSVAEGAFMNNAGIYSVIFSGSVKSIGSGVLANCNQLKCVYVPSGATISDDAFSYVGSFENVQFLFAGDFSGSCDGTIKTNAKMYTYKVHYSQKETFEFTAPFVTFTMLNDFLYSKKKESRDFWYNQYGEYIYESWFPYTDGLIDFYAYDPS